jgi:hypothetical protein
VFRSLLRIYSAIFRFGGLAIAVLSLIVSAGIGLGIVRDGYVLIDGRQSRDVGAFITAVGTPLLGVAAGLALFYLVPKLRSTAEKGRHRT